MRSRKPKKRSAWLITWESFGRDHEIQRPRVVAILRPQLGSGTIKAILPVLFISESRLTFSEKMGYGLTRQSESHLSSYHGDIRCGGNPHLLARLVSDLYVEEHDKTIWVQTLHWTERPKCKLEDLSHKPIEITPARHDSEEVEFDRLWDGVSYLEQDRAKGLVD